MLAAYPDEFEQQDFVQEALLACQGDPRGFELLLQSLRQAEQLRPAAILTTCSMYTPHMPAARRLVATPVVGVDEAMLDEAARIGGPWRWSALWKLRSTWRPSRSDAGPWG